MRGISNNVALVTGSGRGIGRAIATRLAEEGATVAINDIEAERAETTAEELRAVGHDAFAAPADVTDLTDVQSTVDDILEQEGQIDILVNNAGWDRVELFKDNDPEVWNRIIDINYRGQVNCARAVMDNMMERETGKIIAISSDAGRVGSTGEAVYAGTKAGAIGFTKTLARELARFDVQCNVISPGPTETPLLEEMQEETEIARKIHDGMENHIPLGRKAKPEDIASGVAFFASSDADYVTGQVLSVSGGLTMC
ncbi:SDR family NAD(P)-dependent oxidoreductase [Natrononativus amylolyticus]|uniref:SDR family NAD(P)-dependent oxidoreductase n=1 Tax=Natrononativus amylolyticus TaxID=2963434 RepID=UPI0020CEE2AB|nr:3-oxoacyl-ACP reductase family protein [Natrononativus amylolyticus]